MLLRGRKAPLPAVLLLAVMPLDTEAPGVAVASVDVVAGPVERTAPGSGWKAANSGFRIRTGEQIRTGPDALARIGFPFMSILVGSSSTFSISPSLVLSTSLQTGRVEQFAEGTEAIKLRTPEAEVRGGGRVVVRREEAGTRVAVLDGRFRVEAAGGVVSLERGQGTMVAPGQHPSTAVSLPAPPTNLAPGNDPVYVQRGRPVSLSWTRGGSAHHIQVLGLHNDEILIDRDVGPSPAMVEIPWPGTYRWRVATRDPRGLEGLPSKEGVVCVMEK